MQKEQIEELVTKYLNNTATSKELDQLSAWYRTVSAEELEWFAGIQDEEALLKAAMLKNIQKEIDSQTRKSTPKLWPRIAVAAAAVAAIVFGVWFYNTSYMNGRQVGGRHPELVSGSQDIAPGKNTATLTLANGSIIQLSDTKTGVVIDPNEMKYNDGTALSGLQPSLPEGERMLTATTPRGGQYQFTLPDGTKVWLNAASSLKFPSQFSGTNRKILLSGEAYLEVSKNKAKPFIVESKGQQVTVLGTHFNINAYTDEGNTKTTLLEGSVKVRNTNTPLSPQGGSLPGGERSVVLKPNEQATNTGSAIKVTTVNTDQTISWKDGKFTFNNTNLDEVLRQLARWYDVDIKYLGPVPNKQFSGDIYRNLNASEALELLKFTKVNFRIEGKTIIVSN